MTGLQPDSPAVDYKAMSVEQLSSLEFEHELDEKTHEKLEKKFPFDAARILGEFLYIGVC